jgi:protein-S-isoprenylcysteine O-methyltransferase Ste14
MTRSASTPRLRLTQGFYAVLALSGLVAGAAPPAPTVGVMLNAAAFLAVAAACLGRLWCSAHIAGRKDVALVTTGPYAWCRHPLYAWSLLAGIGLGVATHTWTWPLLTAAFLAVIFLRETAREDRLLADLHGAAFRDYAARVPALWPRRPAPGAILAPTEIALRPDLFRKAFLDAGSMLLLLLLVMSLTALRHQGLLPRLLSLP